ncbi:hypothetical protein V8F33_000280 [Rhypophila sp. PSN 637]
MSQPSEKVAFFNLLDSLDCSIDGDGDGDGDGDRLDQREQDHRAKSRAFFGPKKPREKSALLADAGIPTPRRVASAPTPLALKVIKATPTSQNPKVARLPREDGPSVISETPLVTADSARPSHPSLLRRSTVPLAAPTPAIEQSPSVTTVSKKRKRQTQTQTGTVPESEMIFRDLAFFYIPNNDIAPARKLRIKRAQEYGARWVRDLSGASHVVVDKNLTFKDIQKILGSTLDSSLVVVTEDYPIECVNFQTLLNPVQNRYRVPGCPLPAPSASAGPADVIIPSSQASDQSLQVKGGSRARERVRSLREGTPLRSEDLSPQKNTRQPSRQPSPRDAEAAPGALSNNSQQGVSAMSKSESPAREPSTDQPQANRPTTTHKDDLSEYINLMRQYKDLPLDNEEEDDLQSTADPQDDEIEDSSSSEEERSKRRRSTRITRPTQKYISSQDRFACHKGGTKSRSQDSTNPNSRTIEILQQMCDYYTRIDDHWRTTAYRKAITTLKKQTTKITSESQAYALPNIGRRLAQKIEEIVNTDRLKRLEYANDEPLDNVLELFLKIYDVGTSRANKWISQGFRTLDDLKERAALTTNQRAGVEHFDDLNTRIPREEVTLLGEYVKKEAKLIDPAVELLIGGSYRRGSDSSGDIDFIVTKKDAVSSGELVPFLKELIEVLERKGFITATLAALHSERSGKNGAGSKWHGCCVLPSDTPNAEGKSQRAIWRRIDFLLVPETEYGAALIYFTGNDIFNRSMRLLASKKGMRLNQRGLYRDVMLGKGRVKVTDGELVEGRDEKRIFEILGVKWREPSERWC